MTTPTGISVQLRFEDGSEPIHDLRVHKLDYADALNQPFSLTLGVLSTDSAIEPKLVLGKQVDVLLASEPWLSHLRGIVVGFNQRTAFGGPDGASMYEIAIRPPLWLLGKRFARRIHQDATAFEVIAARLLALEGASPPPANKVGRALERPEYTVQYDETDLAFARRLLAENHLVSFFDWTAGGAWTIAGDLASAAPTLPTPLVYRPPSGGLTPTMPHALSLTTNDELGEIGVSLRDYNFEHPQLVRSSPAGLDGKAAIAPLPNERGGREDLRLGRFDSDPEGAVIARRELDALRAKDHVVTCSVNLAMSAGTCFSLVDHPRTDLGREFLVVGSRSKTRSASPTGATTSCAAPPRPRTA